MDPFDGDENRHLLSLKRQCRCAELTISQDILRWLVREDKWFDREVLDLLGEDDRASWIVYILNSRASYVLESIMHTGHWIASAEHTQTCSICIGLRSGWPYCLLPTSELIGTISSGCNTIEMYLLLHTWLTCLIASLTAEQNLCSAFKHQGKCHWIFLDWLERNKMGSSAHYSTSSVSLTIAIAVRARKRPDRSGLRIKNDFTDVKGNEKKILRQWTAKLAASCDRVISVVCSLWSRNNIQ